MGAMSVNLKTPEEIELMRIAGRLASEVLDIVTPHVKPGVTTEELDRICHDHIINVQKATPANVGYRGFPKTVCTSVNNVICHGIPSEAKVLKDGDIVNIDVTVIDPPAILAAGPQHHAFGLGLEGIAAKRGAAEATFQRVDLELAGVGFVLFGDQQAVVGGVAPDRSIRPRAARPLRWCHRCWR